MPTRAKSKKPTNFTSYLGAIFIVSALWILANLFGPVAKEEIRYQWRQTVYEDQAMSNYPCPETDFTIGIFQLGVCAKVIPNVDPFDSRLYQQALTQGVAHARGTGMPGEGRNIFLFAHSSGNPLDAARYNSIFYLLYKLDSGDKIELFKDGRTYDYLVASQQIVSPRDVQYLQDTNEEILTLMTCWPPGTTFKRLIVIAKPM